MKGYNRKVTKMSIKYKNFFNLNYILLFLIVASAAVTIIISSCSSGSKPNIPTYTPPPSVSSPPESLPADEVNNKYSGLEIYTSPNIKGYNNELVIVDSLFIPAMNEINYFAEKNNLTLIVTSSFRPADKNISGAIVTPAKYSNHLVGHAIDINIVYKDRWYESSNFKRSNLKKCPKEIQNFFREIRSAKNLRWGGDFYKQDPVHIDDHCNKNLEAWQKRYDLCQQEYSEKWGNS